MLEGTDGAVFAGFLGDGAPEVAAGGLRGDDVDDCVPEALSLRVKEARCRESACICLSPLWCVANMAGT